MKIKTILSQNQWKREIGTMMNEEKIEESPVAEDYQTNRSNFRQELKELINTHSMENGSNTPDFLLAEYLSKSLELFDVIVERRDCYSTLPEQNEVNNG